MAKKETPVTSVDATTSEVDSSYPRDTSRAEFFGFQNRSSVFSFDKDGNIISRKLVWPEEPMGVSRDTRAQFSLPFSVRGISGFPVLPLGLTLVSGSTAVGKSTFVRALGTRMPLRRLLTVEPFDTGEEIETLPAYSSIDTALAAAVSGSYSEPNVLYALDSLRATLFETSGAAGSKGMSMPFFTQITRVSNALALGGITVMATVNPMDEDPDYVKQFMSKLSASVPATILLDSMTRVGDKDASFSGSLQMRPNRAKLPFTFNTADAAPAKSELISAFDFEPFNTADTLSINKAAVAAISKAI